jgi:hypothetical protein
MKFMGVISYIKYGGRRLDGQSDSDMIPIMC